MPAARHAKQGPGDYPAIPYAEANAVFCGAVRGAGLSPASPRTEGTLRPQALAATLMLLLEGRVCRLLSSARACASASWPWALLALGKAT